MAVPLLGDPIPITVGPGSLGISVRTELDGYGIKVDRVSMSSQLVNAIFPGDYIVEFEGSELLDKPIQNFKKLLGNSAEKPNRMLLFRPNLKERSNLMQMRGNPLVQTTINPSGYFYPNNFNIPMQQNSGWTNMYPNQNFPSPSPTHTMNNWNGNANTMPYGAQVGATSFFATDGPNGERTNEHTITKPAEKTIHANKTDANMSSTNTNSHLQSSQPSEIVNKSGPVVNATKGNEKSSHPRIQPDVMEKGEKQSNLIHNAEDVSNRSILSNTSTNDDEMKKQSKTRNSTNKRETDKFDPSHKCDICGMRDGYHGLSMQKCKTCEIYVHEECYGLTNEYKKVKYPDWQCWACLSVGKKITVKDSNNVNKEILIKERPTQCALCPIKSGCHAMHPLYDKHSSEGQPLVKQDNTTVWVHTLCAIFICAFTPTINLVYGCDEKGTYDFSSQDEDDNQNSNFSQNRNFGFFSHYDGYEEVLTAVPHHFVITSKGSIRGSATDTEMLTLRESRELKCHVCQNPDVRSRRIPVQCLNKECCVAYHVGCAKWMANANLLKIFPGNDDSDPLMEFYCPKHSRTICKIVPKPKKVRPKLTNNDAAYNIDDDESRIFDSDSDDMGEDVPKKHASIRKKDVEEKADKGKKDSKYFQKKRRLEQSLEKMVQDLKIAIKEALSKDIDIEVVKRRRRAYWKQHGELTKGEFTNLWSKCEVKIQDDERKALEYQNKKPGKLKRRRSNEEKVFESRKLDDNSIRKRQTKSKWMHLFLPYYNENAPDLNDDRYFKTIDISESELDDDER